MNKSAFTLIELLVVVLIIGILAAIALPQYQVAVDKSRYSTMMPYVRALYDAQELHRLETGSYSTNFDELVIQYPEGTPLDSSNRPILGSMRLETNGLYATGHYIDSNKNVIASYGIYFPTITYKFGSIPAAGKRTCMSYGSYLTRGDKICKSLGGTIIAEGYNCGVTCNVYELP